MHKIAKKSTPTLKRSESLFYAENHILQSVADNIFSVANGSIKQLD